MASWKLLIYSGSSAALASLTLDTALGVAYGGTGLSTIGANNFIVGTGNTTYVTTGSTGTGAVVRVTNPVVIGMSGSFSGSFVGNGSGLTGVISDSTFALHGDNGTSGSFSTATDIIKFATASVHGFNFSVVDSGTTSSILLNTPQDLRTTANVQFAYVTGSTFKGTSIPTGLDNTVLVVDSAGNFVTDEIDARVWGTSLIDGGGANTRVAYYTDSDTIGSDANFTYNGTILNVGTSTFGTNTIIAGDLTVLGDTFQANITNLMVEDRFALLNSGSATGDGGIIVQTESGFSGSAFGWYDAITRFAVQMNTKLGASAVAIVPDAYMAVVVDVDGGMTDLAIHQKPGNIKIENSSSYIWI